MKLFLLFSVIPDLDGVDASRLQIAGTDITIPFPHYMYDPCCESAAELTLQLRDSLVKLGEQPTLQACTVGPASADRFCQEFFAHGFSDVFRVDADFDPSTSPASAAHMLSEAIRDKIDSETIILTGQWGGLRNNAQIPVLLAHYLGLPYYGDVTGCGINETRRLSVLTQTDDGVLECAAPLPALLSVGNCPQSYLRSPTLQARLLSQGSIVSVVPPAAPLHAAALQAQSAGVVRSQRAAATVPGDDLDAQIDFILQFFSRQ